MSLHFAHPVDDDETVSLGSNDSTTSTGSKLSRDSGFSEIGISLNRELQNLRRQMNKPMCCKSELGFTHMEALGRNLEEERVVHVLKHEEQHGRMGELESFQKHLGLEQKAHSELIDTITLKIKELASRINSLSRRGEIRDNELMKLTQRFEETSAESNVKVEDSHTQHAEDRKICQNNNERSSQLEELMQRFETQIAETNAKLSEFESEHALHAHKSEGQDDRIVELELFQQQLGLERKVQSEQIESEHVSRRREIEELRAQINSLSGNNEVRNNDLRELRQRFEQTSAELNVKFEESYARHAEVFKICRNNTEWCSQFEELTPKFDQQSELDQPRAASVNFKTFRESRLASDRKTCQELIEVDVKSHASVVQDLIAMFNARSEDLTICLDAGYADREEKQKEQNQAKISSKTLESTLAENLSSQKELIEAESMLRMQTAQSTDRESRERHMQLQNLESPVKAEIKANAETIQ